MSSTWKNRISVSIFGQSHGAAIGVTLDGVPAGEKICMDKLNAFLKRRAPGRFPWATPRKEEDVPEILSGIVDGVTCGAPITAIIRNTNTRSGDYANTQTVPRPGHADFTAHVKYGGNADLRGGGHFSGRLTGALCIAGGICLQILERRGIFIGAHIESIGEIYDASFHETLVNEDGIKALCEKDFPAFDANAAQKMIAEIEKVKQDGDSIGGTIECAAVGLPAGLGSPMFDGMENRISQLVFAIPAVKGIEFGEGFGFAFARGSEVNDSFTVKDGKVQTETNNHGGILGGITSGMPLIFRAVIKPTPSISRKQKSVDLNTLQPATLEVKGRHDPCIVPRAVPCFEAAAAIAIYDAILAGGVPC
ncbi:MAG: chorismate synthase [Defluviitaleaceae bacterium]|nr:chorismate synthase [Defluviitaleaceae bacterium]MCL2264309.1 chorismate synthase [Defluviitaleaceae bacterium]